LFLPCFLPEREAKLKFRLFRSWNIVDAGFIGEEEIIESIGDGLVEEGGHTEEAL